jgi:ribosomal protein S18 acetylase RimI-like enzyme
LYHLAVDDRFRHKGIGRALMAEVEERLRRKGCSRMTLSIAPSSPDGLRYFESLGWVRSTETLMTRDLPGQSAP